MHKTIQTCEREYKSVRILLQDDPQSRNWISTGRSLNCIFGIVQSATVAYPGIFFVGGSINSVEDTGERERGSEGGSPLVRGSGGSCNLVQEISFHMVKFS